MRIIKEGSTPGTRPIVMDCFNCETLFEFLEAEAEYIGDQRDGDFYRLKCPVCMITLTKDIRSCK